MKVHVANFELVQSVSPDPAAVLIRTDVLIHRKTRDLTDRQFGLLVRLWVIALKYGNDFELSDYFKGTPSSLKDLLSLQKKKLIKTREDVLELGEEREKGKEPLDEILAKRKAIHDRVLEDFNMQTGREGKHRFTESEDLMKRIMQGIPESILLAVVGDRVGDWHGDPEMQQWLKPSTVFRPKNFRRYAEDLKNMAGNQMIDNLRRSIFTRRESGKGADHGSE